MKFQWIGAITYKLKEKKKKLAYSCIHGLLSFSSTVFASDITFTNSVVLAARKPWYRHIPGCRPRRLLHCSPDCWHHCSSPGPSSTALVDGIVEPANQGNRHIRRHHDESLKVVRPSVRDGKVDEQDTDHERDSLERVEEEHHGLSDRPTDQNEDREDTERDLDRRPDRDRHREVQFVLHGDGYSSNVFYRVSDH